MIRALDACMTMAPEGQIEGGLMEVRGFEAAARDRTTGDASPARSPESINGSGSATSVSKLPMRLKYFVSLHSLARVSVLPQRVYRLSESKGRLQGPDM